MGLVKVAVTWLLVLSLVRVAGAPAERCPSVTVNGLRSSVTEVIDWFQRNQYADGRFLYSYDAPEDRDLGVYESLRHAASMMALYQATLDGFPQALAIADRADRWAEPLLTARHGGLALAQPGGAIEIGASALYLAGLIYRRRVTGDVGYDERMEAVARFLVATIQPSGSVPVMDVDSGPIEHSPYPTAQVFWALAMMQNSFPGQGWDRPARQIATYLATKRDSAEHIFPTWSDHWAAYGYAEMSSWPGGPPLTGADVAYVRRLAGVMSTEVRWESQRTGSGLSLLVRGDLSVPSGLGTVGEGLSALWRTAGTDPRLASLPAPIAERVSCAAGILTQRQTSAAAAARYPSPGRVEGAWFKNGMTRLDDQQHTLSTLLPAIGILQASGGTLPNSIGSSTSLSAVLLALALVLAFDPFRFALRVRRRVDSAALPVALGALGIVMIALAILASPMLDALHISAPTARISVALVLLVGGLVSLISAARRGVATDDDTSAAVLVLTETRPSLLLLAVVVGADHGVLPTAVGAVVALALGYGLAVRSRRWNDRVLRWASGLCTVALIVIAVALLVDGVFSV